MAAGEISVSGLAEAGCTGGAGRSKTRDQWKCGDSSCWEGYLPRQGGVKVVPKKKKRTSRSFFNEGRQCFRFGAAKPEHLFILVDDLQGPAFTAKPYLFSVTQGNIDRLDTFDLSPGKFFFRMPNPSRASRFSPVTEIVSGFQKHSIRIGHGNRKAICNQSSKVANQQDSPTMNSAQKDIHNDLSVLR